MIRTAKTDYAEEQRGYVEWGWHVAPYILVKDGDKEIPMVLDPSLFNGPVTYGEWVKAQGDDKSKHYLVPLGGSTEKGSDYMPTSEEHVNKLAGGGRKGGYSISKMVEYKQKERVILGKENEYNGRPMTEQDYIRRYYRAK
jgi:hypothetical protein